MGSLRLAAVALLLLPALTCSPDPRLAARDAAAPSAPAAPPSPSRRALLPHHPGPPSSVGPRWAGGTLLVLSGRRALVAADGAITDEEVSLPGLVHELREVVDRQGAARVVGQGWGQIFLLDARDPLGKARVRVDLGEGMGLLGAMPGVLVVGGEAGPPLFVDLETGAPSARPPLPELPLHAVAFRSASEGAAVFGEAGLAVSADGGRSFRLVTGDTRAVVSVVLRGGDLVALTGGEEPPMEATIDVAHASLGALHPPEPPSEPATVRWVRRTRTDPLAEAIDKGVLLPGGGAVVAAPGLLARVDAASGAVAELVEIGPAPARFGYRCRVDRAGGALWASCQSERRWSLFQIHAEGALRADPPVAESTAPGNQVRLVTGTGGGALWTAPCAPQAEKTWCVRQPDGRWQSVAVPFRGQDSAGPLADGRVAFLGDDPETLRVEAVGPDGATAELAIVRRQGECTERLRPSGSVEEDEEGLLHFMVDSPCGTLAVAQRAGGPTTQVGAVLANRVRLRHGRGWAVHAGAAAWSRDWGLTWGSLPVPADAGDVAESFGPPLLAGWLPSAEMSPAPPVPVQALRAVRRPPPPPLRRLRCASLGRSSAVAPYAEHVAREHDPLGIGAARHVSFAPGSRAMLDRAGPRWTLRWLDGAEVSGKPHLWSGVPVPALTADLELMGGRVRGGRAVLLFSSNGPRAALGFARDHGNLSVTPLDRDVLSFDGDVAMGDGDVVGWLASEIAPGGERGEVTRVFAMQPGGPPQVVTTVRTGGPSLLLGVSRDALLVLASEGHGNHAAAQVVPVPAGAAPPASLERWLAVAALDAARLGPCDAGADGFAMRVTEALHGGGEEPAPEIDGERARRGELVYELRVAAPNPHLPLPETGERPLRACVTAMAADIEDDAGRMVDYNDAPRWEPPPKLPAGRKAMTFVRFDALKGSAEGGSPGAVRNMRCTLEAAP